MVLVYFCDVCHKLSLSVRAFLMLHYLIFCAFGQNFGSIPTYFAHILLLILSFDLILLSCLIHFMIFLCLLALSYVHFIIHFIMSFSIFVIMFILCWLLLSMWLNIHVYFSCLFIHTFIFCVVKHTCSFLFFVCLAIHVCSFVCG